MNKKFSKEELKAFKEYDGSFDDDKGFEVKDFSDLKKDDSEPLPQVSGVHGEHVLVGGGAVTNPNKCGDFMYVKGCLHVENHNVVDLTGVNHVGKVYAKNIFNSCDSPSCPICYRRGWAVREAKNIKRRLDEASKRFGLIEHIVLSIPESLYGMPYAKLRGKVVEWLKVRGIYGGCFVFHGFRYASFAESIEKKVPMGWYWSPHFHIGGFVEGGYAQCRKCKKTAFDCMSCSGFENRTRKVYEKDGIIVKVMAERKTIVGTFWYQLNHASMIQGKGRAQVVTWFGTCSYKKLKLKKEDRVDKDVCPICGEELEHILYVGKDCYQAGNDFFSEFTAPYLDVDGLPNWILAPSR